MDLFYILGAAVERLPNATHDENLTPQSHLYNSQHKIKLRQPISYSLYKICFLFTTHKGKYIYIYYSGAITEICMVARFDCISY